MAILGSTIVNGDLKVTGTINGFKLNNASAHDVDTTLDGKGASTNIPTSKAIIDYVTAQISSWKSSNSKSSGNISLTNPATGILTSSSATSYYTTATLSVPAGYYASAVSKTVPTYIQAGDYSASVSSIETNMTKATTSSYYVTAKSTASITKDGYVKAGSKAGGDNIVYIPSGGYSVSGGDLSVGGAFTPSISVSSAGTNIGGSVSATQGTYYVKVHSASNAGSVAVSRGAINASQSAGYIPASTAIQKIAADSKSATINAGSADRFINIPAGSLTSFGSDNATLDSYASKSVSVPADGYLIIGAGYYPNTKISLADLIPDDADYSNAGSSQILEGFEAYSTTGSKLIGTVKTLSPASYVTTAGSLPIGPGYLSRTYYVPNGSVTNGGSITTTSLNPGAGTLSKNGAVNSGTEITGLATLPASAPTDGSYYINLLAGVGSATGTVSGKTTASVSAGYVSASPADVDISKSVTINPRSDSKIVAIQAGAYDTPINSSSGDVSGSNVTLSGTDSSGISVSGRGNIGWKARITKDGFLRAGEKTNSAWSSYATKYITDLTVSAGKALNSISLAAGTADSYAKLGTLSFGASSNLGNLTGSGSISNYTATGSINVMTGGRTINVLGNSTTAGTLNITNNTYGTVNVFGGGNADKGTSITGHTVKTDGTTVTNSSGDLITTSLTSSASYTNLSNPTVTSSIGLSEGATSYGLTTTKPTAGTYITLTPRGTGSAGSIIPTSSYSVGTGWITSTSGTINGSAVTLNANVSSGSSYYQPIVDISGTGGGLTTTPVNYTPALTESKKMFNIDSSDTPVSMLHMPEGITFLNQDDEIPLGSKASSISYNILSDNLKKASANSFIIGLSLSNDTADVNVPVTREGITYTNTAGAIASHNSKALLGQTTINAHAMVQKANKQIYIELPPAEYAKDGSNMFQISTTYSANSYEATIAAGGNNIKTSGIATPNDQGSSVYTQPLILKQYTGSIASLYGAPTIPAASVTILDGPIAKVDVGVKLETTENNADKDLAALEVTDEISIKNLKITSGNQLAVTNNSGGTLDVANAGNTNITSDTGTTKYLDWIMDQDADGNLTFTYGAIQSSGAKMIAPLSVTKNSDGDDTYTLSLTDQAADYAKYE